MERLVVNRLTARVGPDHGGVLTRPGWDDILDWVDRAIASLYPDYQLHQVKQKFGSLRYYTNMDTKTWVREVTMMAALQSARTCEECGRDGELRDAEWVQILCNEHFRVPVKKRTMNQPRRRRFGRDRRDSNHDADVHTDAGPGRQAESVGRREAGLRDS